MTPGVSGGSEAARARIIDEPPGAGRAVAGLLDRCFGAARRLMTAERLREGGRPAAGLAIAAVADDGRLVGTLRLWPIVAASGQPLLLLGPLAVDPAWRGLRIGGSLVRHGLGRAGRLGHQGVVLVGDEPYYRAFGFSRGPTRGLALPGPVDPRRFLGLDLVPGTLARAAGLLRPAPAPASLPRAA
jgi:predicted N-acetyltransferase YhbS